MSKIKSGCDTDDAWYAYPGERRSIEVYASDTPPGRLGFDLRPRRERLAEQRREARKLNRKKK